MANSLEQSLTEMQVHGSIIANKVFVGGLAEQTETKDLREMFTQYAPVQDVKIIVDRSVTSKSGDPRRYAFIAFETADEVKKVLAELNEKSLDLHGRRLTVGQAYRKSQCNRMLGGYPTMTPDPLFLYRAAINSWAYAAAPKAVLSPTSPSPYFYYPTMEHTGCMMPQTMMHTGYPTGTISAPPSPAGSGMHPSSPCHGGPVAFPANPMNYAKNVIATMNGGMDMNGNNGNQCSIEDPASSDVYMQYKQQQNNIPQFQSMEQRQRAGTGRVLGIGQPFRVQQSTQQNGGPHYLHQGPMNPAPLSADSRFIAPSMRQFV
jgi:hypothetical protein